MNVKAYDKMLDLLGREGCRQIGTRISTILGCGYGTDTFQKRLCKVQIFLYTSCTRASLIP